MTVLLTAPVAGAYTGAYNSSALGIMNDEGFVLTATPQSQDINDTDQFAKTLIEFIYQGMNFGVRFRTKEWNAGMQGAFQVYGAVAAGVAPSFTLGVIGRLGTAISKTLVLTSTAATPAVASPATLTSTQAVLAPNSNLEVNFTSKIREVPISMNCIPYSTTIASVSYNLPWTTA